MDLALADLGVVENLLDWLQSVLEVVSAELLELGSCQSDGQVLSVLEGIDIDLSLHDS